MEKAHPHFGRSRFVHLIMGALAVSTSAPLFQIRPARADFISPIWSGTAGDWFDSSQWTPNLIPNNDPSNLYAPIINAGTVTLSAPATTNGLTLASPALLTLGPANTLSLTATGSSFISGTIVLADGSLFDSQQNLTLSNASITGTGTLHQSGATLTLLGASSITNFSLGSVTLSGGGTLHLNSGSWSAGTLTGASVTLDPSGQTSILGPMAISAGTLTNNGTLYLGVTPTGTFAPFSLNLASNASIVNNGTLFLEAFISATGSGTLTNNGVITHYPSSQFAAFPIQSVLNSGTITGDYLLRSGSSSGLLSPDSGPNRLMTLNTFTLTDGAIVTSADNGTINCSGTLTVVGNVTADHLTMNTLSGPGTLNLSGPNSWVGLTASSTGQIHVGNSGTLSITGTSQTIAIPSIVNDGVLFDDHSIFTGQSFILDNRGTITLQNVNGSGLGILHIFNSGIMTIGTTTGIQLYNTGTITATTMVALNSSAFVDNGSASGTFLAPTTSTGFSFAISTKPYVLDGADLSGAGAFSGFVSLLHTTTVSNASFNTVKGNGILIASQSMLLPVSLGPGTQVTVLPSGTLTGPNVIQTYTFDASTLTLQGISTGTLAGSLLLKNGASLINQGTLTPTIFFSLSTTGSPSGSVINSGIMTFSSFSGTTFASTISLVNTGTLTSTTSLTAQGGGSSSGLFVAPGSGSFTFSDNDQTFLLNNATLSGEHFSGAIALSGTSTADSGNFSKIIGPGSLTLGHTLTLPSGTITGGAHVTVLPQGTLSITIGSSILIDNAILSNFGTGNIFTGAPSANIVFTLNHGAIFENAGALSLATQPGLNVLFNSDNTPGTVFINSGAISYPIAGPVPFSVPLFNTGTLSISSNSLNSTLQLFASGSASGLIQTTSPFASFVFYAPYTLNNATVSGNIFAGAPITLIGNVSAYGLSINDGLLGNGSLSGGAFEWHGGTFANSGGILINGTSSRGIVLGTLIVSNVMANLSFEDFSNLITSPAKILDGITMTLVSNLSAAWSTTGATADSITFKNGTQFINHGTFYSYLASNTFANADQHPANAFINTGTFGRSSLTIAAAVNVTTLQIPFHNSGIVDIQQGTIDFAGGYFDDNPATPNTADFHFAPNTGLQFSGSNYDFGDSPFDLGPGGLYGSGTVHGNFTSSGTIAPASAPATLTLTGNLSLTNAGTINVIGGTLLFAGGTQTLAGTLLGSKGGALLFSSSALTISSSISLSSASAIFNANSQSIASITGNGSVTVASNLTSDAISVSSLTLTGTATHTIRPSPPNTPKINSLALITSNLTISPNTSLDLSNHDAMIGNANLSTISNQILRGFNLAGSPTDPAITSSSALSNHNAFLVPLDADALLGNGTPGSAIGKIFDGTPITQPNTILINYALFGDATLDGTIDGLDYATLISHFGQTTPGTNNIELSWLAGDFNLDGTVNAADFALAQSNLGATPSFTSASLSTQNSALSTSPPPIPEPLTLLLLTPALIALVLRRIRRRSNFTNNLTPTLPTLT